MTKKSRRRAGTLIPFQPIVQTQAPGAPPAVIPAVKRGRFRPEWRVVEREGDVAALRRLIDSATIEEVWEVPG